jgi:OOP family OmpA-OmpF porin
MSRMIIAVMLLGFVGMASAEDRGFQFGFGLGKAKIEDTVFGVPIDDRDFSWKVFGGYQFNRYLAAEIAFHDGLNRKYTDLDHTARLETKASQASVIGSIPMGEYLSVFARAGMSKWDAKASISGPILNDSIKDDGADPSYGAGIGLLYDGALLRFEYERGKFEDATAKFLSLSIVWMFR